MIEVSAAHDSVTVCGAGAAPEPVSPTIADVDALLANVKFAVAVPLAVGAKMTLKGIV